MAHQLQVYQTPRSLTQPNNEGYTQHTSMTTEQHNGQASAFNWLNAISGDNGNFDPRFVYIHISLLIDINSMIRTYRVHQTTTCNNKGELIIADPLYAPTLERAPYTYSVVNWVRVTQHIPDTIGFEIPEEWEESSCCSSADSLLGGLQTPIKLEAEPPFPKPNTPESSLFDPHNQISKRSEA